MSEYARLDLIPTSDLATSYLIFPPLAFNNSSHRSVEIYLVAVHDNTSVAVIQTGAEASTTVELDSFETFSMKRTVFDATGIRILSSNLIAVFISDSSEGDIGHFPTAGAQFSKTEAQFPTTEAQFPTTEAQFSKTEAQFPTAEAQFPTSRDDDLCRYFTVMQIPPDIHWSDTYRLEMVDCQRHEILIGIAGKLHGNSKFPYM